jgi:GT2 family glycosyltransferase
MSTISTIIPTIGRAESLAALLESILIQSVRPDEILVADGSDGSEIESLLNQSRWKEKGLQITHLSVSPPNAVRQRKAAIAAAKGDYLFMLDDDIVLEPDCLKQMADLLDQRPELSAVTADFSNQTWSNPTTLWRWYMRIFHGIKKGEWQGRVIGPLLRFGYNPSPAEPMPMQWLGAGNSLIRRSAYEAVGGFSDFFLHRCTMNEDVDLGLKLSRHGPIVLHPRARMAHHHAPGGRVSIAAAAEDDIYNRFMVLRQNCRHSRLKAWLLTASYALLEILSNLLGALRRWRFDGFLARTSGRLKGLAHALQVAEPNNSRS